ncbi:piggyBac transposable element-derived protein 2-like [Ischnura elegans]|uniref:piggyBac transposable element-derived protein 2-like n=2 Tax=Ischnura elegans TaxID=197161 RepID=UPI001ED87E29|nr:piggyBac transposable element-derived protein 2-like [Ischnura elegans]
MSTNNRKRSELNTEDILFELHNLDDNDERGREIDGANTVDVVILPARDGDCSDEDDAPEECETPECIKDLGKGVLAQLGEVRLDTNHGKIDLPLFSDDCSSTSSNNNEVGSDFDMSNEKNGKNCHSKRRKVAKSSINVCSATNTHKKFSHLEAGSYRKKDRSWKKLTLKTNNMPPLEPVRMQPKPELLDKSPLEMFKRVWDENFVNMICIETNKYAVQKGLSNAEFSVDDLYKYLGVLLLSGYCCVPFRRMYWETKRDTFHSLVAGSMSRNKFDLIHKCLHFNDNTQIDSTDRIYKVRPVVDHMNKKFTEIIECFGSEFSLDEGMEPYFGRHSMKQFIRGKPIRFGYKIWCVTTSKGYLLKFSVYTGKTDRPKGISLGAQVTESMCVDFLPPGSKLFVDNFFTSLSLLEKLKESNINCIGTIRKDRIEGAPVVDVSKEERGAFSAITDKNSPISLIRWHDNAQVTIATNMDSKTVFGLSSCTRWNSKYKKHMKLCQPQIVKMYNHGMGGVDLFDQQRAVYRVKIRSNKWYWPLFRFCLNSSIVNLWHIFRINNRKSNQIDFLREVVIGLLSSDTQPKLVAPRTMRQAITDGRFDGHNHWISKIKTHRRCGHCGKSSKFICEKCNVGVHPDCCFKEYHVKYQSN